MRVQVAGPRALQLCPPGSQGSRRISLRKKRQRSLEEYTTTGSSTTSSSTSSTRSFSRTAPMQSYLTHPFCKARRSALEPRPSQLLRIELRV